ncbi:MAG: hypothetical protein LBR53_02435 [Deltaproteobacteria bacterium]|nr:hypothetical protein [Deltaproteobacteria bacterium]
MRAKKHDLDAPETNDVLTASPIRIPLSNKYLVRDKNFFQFSAQQAALLMYVWMALLSLDANEKYLFASLRPLPSSNH